MYEFYGSTVDKFHWGRRYLTERFFTLVAARFCRPARLGGREEGRRPVAGAFNVKKGDRLYGRYWGSSPVVANEPFLHFNVCYYHGIRECIAGGLAVFEPGAGGEHKKARGFLPTVTHSAHWIADARLRRLLAAHLDTRAQRRPASTCRRARRERVQGARSADDA